MAVTHGPSISVVIPARNDAIALEGCLQALQYQSLAPLEVVVVDNASSDATAEVARRYGARVLVEEQVGIPQAAAAGYDSARGDVIARLDADSRPGAGWLEGLERLLRASRWDAVTGTGYFYELPRTGRAVARVYLGIYYVLCHAALGHRPLWGSNMALRREVWQQVREHVHDDDAELHDDLDLAFALGPDRAIRLERSLAVGVSVRSLLGWAQLRRRFRRALRTLAVNWSGFPPWKRWAASLGARLRR